MKRFMMMVLVMGGTFFANAQEITDEQLYKYALLNTVIDEMKGEINDVVNEMIKNQDGIDGKRYVELSSAKGNEDKLTELGVNDFEKQFLDLVETEKNERIEDIKKVNQILATKMLGDGGKLYKSIKATLESDESLKVRYQEIKDNLTFPK